MNAIAPIYDGVSIRTGKGRFHVQLEIPETSTLSDSDIDKILALSTWDADPNKDATRYEGRGILIERGHTVYKQGIPLSACEISGIGYEEILVFGSLAIPMKESGFQPPSKGNFFDMIKDEVSFSTSRAVGNHITIERPEYRALGTYTHSELVIKLDNTRNISELTLHKVAVPHIEAYGRYLNDELSNEEGPFGFIVFPIPTAAKRRCNDEIMHHLSSSYDLLDTKGRVDKYNRMVIPSLVCLVQGLREIHDNGYVHLQPHSSNFYDVNGLPYLMDWGTMEKLGKDVEENLLNRSLDIGKLVDNYRDILKVIFPEIPKETEQEISIHVLGLLLKRYLELPDYKLGPVADKVQEVLGMDGILQGDFIVEFLRQSAIEQSPS